MALDGRRLSGKAAVERAEGAARFRIQPPDDMNAMSVAYEDGRSGSIASAYRSGDVTSLGTIVPLGRAQATCVHEKEMLQLLRTSRTSTSALLDTAGLE